MRGEERGGEGGKGRGKQRRGRTEGKREEGKEGRGRMEGKREEGEEEGREGERQQKMRVIGIQRLFHLSPYHMLYGIPHIRLFIQLVLTCQTS